MRSTGGLSLLLAVLLLQPALAAPESAAPRLAVTPVLSSDAVPFASDCGHEIYHTLVKSQQYQVLPDWYVHSHLAPLDRESWEALFEALPEAQEIVLSKIHHVGTERELIAVLLQRGTPPQVLKTEVLPLQNRDPLSTCTQIAQKILGETPPSRFHSPALSATLSFMVPGAGHFYQGSPESIALGSGFLLASVALAVLGFSNSTDPQITRSQWGGLLFLLTLTDIITAYFMASQEP